MNVEAEGITGTGAANGFLKTGDRGTRELPSRTPKPRGTAMSPSCRAAVAHGDQGHWAGNKDTRQ